MTALRARISSSVRTPRLPDPPYRLELGAGPRHREGWTSVDIMPGADLVADVRWRVPLPDSSCTAIFSEHLLEHLRFKDEVPSMLAECMRLLSPGAPIRFSVPDASLYVRGYAGGDLAYLRRLHPADAVAASTAMTTVNWAFHGYGHRFGWDAETLVRVLEAAGFEEVEERGFGDSRYAGLAVETEERALESFYVEGRKP
jgi:predicted SAM-dependent methyltransferase